MALAVLEHLPTAPNGLSIWELADGLLDNRGPMARGRIAAAVQELHQAANLITATTGDDDLGHAAVPLWGIRAGQRDVAAALLDEAGIR